MRVIIFTFFFVLPFVSLAQFGVGFHQSNIPFVSLNYQLKNRLRPELRIGVDNFFEEIGVEGVMVYDFVEKEDYQVYAGAGGRVNALAGLVVPIGVNVFPLPVKQFGFHIELAPIIGNSSVLRASWGIRYRFNGSSSR